MERLRLQQLLVNPENPRHDPVTQQPEAIAALIANQGQKLVVLAKDILDHGMNPLDRLAVTKVGPKYIALEGNRRVLALKLMNNPDLAVDPDIKKAFEKLAKRGDFPDQLDCVVFDAADDARHWIELRHTGAAGGAGVARWSAAASERFRHRPGSHPARAMAFITAARAAYKGDASLLADLETVKDERLTTLGRLVVDPAVRAHLGIGLDGQKLRWDYPADVLKPFIRRIAHDLATKTITVSDILKKEQRAAYLKKLGSPDPKTRREKPAPLIAGAGTGVRPAPVPTEVLFGGFAPTRLGKKVADIVREMRQLTISRSPNTAAILIRVVLELAIDEFCNRKNLTFPKDKDHLRDKLMKCLDQVDPTKKDRKYHGVRTGISDFNSLVSVTTMHQYVHSNKFHATATEIRALAANYEPFLIELDKLA